MTDFGIVDRRGGSARVELPGLLTAIEVGDLSELSAMDAVWRPGVVTSLAVLMTVLRLYSARPRPWNEEAWAAEWDEQLGAGIRSMVGSFGEPVLAQPPVAAELVSKARPISVLDCGCGFTQSQHAEKAKMRAPPEVWLLAILGGTSRPNANYNPATVRGGPLVTLPSDGSLASEVQALTAAYERCARRGNGARDHLPWLRGKPAVPMPIATLPFPFLDIERQVRLMPDGGAVVAPSNARIVARAGWIGDPHVARVVKGTELSALRLNPQRPWSHTVLHWLLAGGEKTSRAQGRHGPVDKVDYTVNPPAVLAGFDQSAVRICGLSTQTGKVNSYREALLPVPRPARSRLGTPHALAASRAILREMRVARGALVTALGAGGLRDRRHPLSPLAPAALQAWDTQAGSWSVSALLDHIGSERTAAELTHWRQAALVAQTTWVWKEATRILDPLARARSERALDRGLAMFCPASSRTDLPGEAG